MNVIFVGRKTGRVKQLDLRHPLVVTAALTLVFGIVGGAFSVGVGLGVRHHAVNSVDQLGGWSAELVRQKAQIDDVRRALQEKVNALAMRVGQMNANVIRLDALGKRLTRMAKMDDGEFDFGNPPAPSRYSPWHRWLGWISAVDLLLTSMTGLFFYYVAFVSR